MVVEVTANIVAEGGYEGVEALIHAPLHRTPRAACILPTTTYANVPRHARIHSDRERWRLLGRRSRTVQASVGAWARRLRHARLPRRDHDVDHAEAARPRSACRLCARLRGPGRGGFAAPHGAWGSRHH